MSALLSRLSLISGAVAFVFACAAFADDAEQCVQQRLASIADGNEPTYGFAATEVEDIYTEVVTKTGFEGWSISLVPCERDGLKAETLNPKVYGYYIVYNPNWVRETFRDRKWDVLVLFAHELAHYKLEHFSDTTKDRVTKETEADRYAGCTIARLGGSLADALEPFKWMRKEVDGVFYPSRDVSLQVVEEGYNECAGSAEPEVVVVPEYEEQEAFSWETEFPAHSGYAYVWIGRYDQVNKRWAKSNFGLSSESPSRIIGEQVVAGAAANLRATLPQSSTVMGPKIGEVNAGQALTVLGIFVYGGKDDGQAWGQIKYD